MIGYMSIEEQVDKDFNLARRRALFGRIRARLRGGAAPGGLLCFDDVRKIPGAMGRINRGLRTVPVSHIGGSVGRCSEFDRDFMPAQARVKEKWKRIDRAFHRGEELPPISLYKIGGFYFVLDGHHRVSVARYHGVEWIDAHVTEFGATSDGAWSDPTRREAGKKDRQRLLSFLDRHATTMPRTALRYAIEHLDKEQREHYLNMKKTVVTDQHQGGVRS